MSLHALVKSVYLSFSTLLILLLSCEAPRTKTTEQAEGEHSTETNDPNITEQKATKSTYNKHIKPAHRLKSPRSNKLLVRPKIRPQPEVAPQMRVRAVTTMQQIEQQLTDWALAHDGSFPESLEQMLDLQPGTEQAYRALPRDPWGHTFTYEKKESKYLLFSNGPDGKAKTDDDIYPRLPGSTKSPNK